MLIVRKGPTSHLPLHRHQRHHQTDTTEIPPTEILDRIFIEWPRAVCGTGIRDDWAQHTATGAPGMSYCAFLVKLFFGACGVPMPVPTPIVDGFGAVHRKLTLSPIKNVSVLVLKSCNYAPCFEVSRIAKYAAVCLVLGTNGFSKNILAMPRCVLRSIIGPCKDLCCLQRRMYLFLY
jgi:hypothetical protein